MNEFEKKMQQQPLRQIPQEWRSEILAAAQAAQPAPHASHRSLLSTINHQLLTILWPHPKAWAALATVWIGILALNLSMQEKAPLVAEKSAPPTPEVMVELRNQQRMFAELMGVNEPREADRRKAFSPSPRSGRTEFLMT